jgi:AmmeMemoRadiSam system protein A
LSAAPPDGADGRGAILLGLARQEIAGGLGLPSRPVADDAPWLAEPGATFVTLHLAGDLRGCIGSTLAHRPLRADVRRNARAAAFSDPRFPPLTRTEYAGIDLEVSLLTPPEPLSARSEAEALRQLVPGRDGVILEHGGRSATFLPQVWEALPEPADFLAQLKRKAGLPAGFWSPEIRLSRYRVEKWDEAGPTPP